jgi:hypothetical protein
VRTKYVPRSSDAEYWVRSDLFVYKNTFWQIKPDGSTGRWLETTQANTLESTKEGANEIEGN